MLREIHKRIISSIILFPILIFFFLQGSYLFNIFILIIFLISTYELYFLLKDRKYSYLGYLLIFISFLSLYLLRTNYNVEVIFFVILICISTDIGGYVFGKILKGPKLIRISPNKTYSGTIGGYILSIVSIYFFITDDNSVLFDVYNLNMILIVLSISTVSQIGDLIVSYLKRLCKVKNTGNIIPGHGGILDRIDGMIFAVPFFYFLIVLNLINI